MENWREELRHFLAKNNLLISQFSREYGFSESTVRDWLNIRKPANPKEEHLKKVVGILAKQRRQPPNTFLRALAEIILKTGQNILDFVIRSTPEEREELRQCLDSGIEDLLDGARGLYSERAREQMISDRRKRQKGGKSS